MNVIPLTKNDPGRDDTYESIEELDEIADDPDVPDDAEGYVLALTDQQLQNLVQVGQAALNDDEDGPSLV